eukprot:2081379-Amphidinium_carterae.1
MMCCCGSSKRVGTHVRTPKARNASGPSQPSIALQAFAVLLPSELYSELEHQATLMCTWKAGTLPLMRAQH